PRPVFAACHEQVIDLRRLDLANARSAYRLTRPSSSLATVCTSAHPPPKKTLFVANPNCPHVRTVVSLSGSLRPLPHAPAPTPFTSSKLVRPRMSRLQSKRADKGLAVRFTAFDMP